MDYQKKTQEIAERAGVPQAQVKKVIKALVDVICQTIKENEDFNIPKFGKFRPSHVKERFGRNFHTNEKTTIKPCLRIRFNPTKDTKNFIKQK